MNMARIIDRRFYPFELSNYARIDKIVVDNYYIVVKLEYGFYCPVSVS